MEIRHKTLKLVDTTYRGMLLDSTIEEYKYSQLPIGAKIIRETAYRSDYNRCVMIELEYEIDPRTEIVLEDVHDEYA